MWQSQLEKLPLVEGHQTWNVRRLGRSRWTVRFFDISNLRRILRSSSCPWISFHSILRISKNSEEFFLSMNLVPLNSSDFEELWWVLLVLMVWWTIRRRKRGAIFQVKKSFLKIYNFRGYCTGKFSHMVLHKEPAIMAFFPELPLLTGCCHERNGNICAIFPDRYNHPLTFIASTICWTARL